jgi:hypothetical protein
VTSLVSPGIAVTLDQQAGIPLLAVANFGTHPAFFPAYLTSAFAFSHQSNSPFVSEMVKHRQFEIHSRMSSCSGRSDMAHTNRLGPTSFIHALVLGVDFIVPSLIPQARQFSAHPDGSRYFLPKIGQDFWFGRFIAWVLAFFVNLLTIYHDFFGSGDSDANVPSIDCHDRYLDIGADNDFFADFSS